jgi:hypothetical protein
VSTPSFTPGCAVTQHPGSRCCVGPDPRRRDGPPNIHRGYEHPLRTAQGFRVLWYFSSQKETLDRATREHRIAGADKALQILAARVGAPRSPLNSLYESAISQPLTVL